MKWLLLIGALLVLAGCGSTQSEDYPYVSEDNVVFYEAQPSKINPTSPLYACYRQFVKGGPWHHTYCSVTPLVPFGRTPHYSIDKNYKWKVSYYW